MRYTAGSVRQSMTERANVFTVARGIPIRTEFGASGRMRGRIEAGEHADVFTTAAIGHARTLVEDGRATVMAMLAEAGETVPMVALPTQWALSRAPMRESTARSRKPGSTWAVSLWIPRQFSTVERPSAFGM